MIVESLKLYYIAFVCGHLRMQLFYRKASHLSVLGNQAFQGEKAPPRH